MFSSKQTKVSNIGDSLPVTERQWLLICAFAETFSKTQDGPGSGCVSVHAWHGWSPVLDPWHGETQTQITHETWHLSAWTVVNKLACLLLITGHFHTQLLWNYGKIMPDKLRW